jgi:mannose-6-phosphate isomerase-like protein (cupin superfamily)
MASDNQVRTSSREAANGAEVVAIGSFITRYLADPAVTGGSYALVEHTLDPGMIGAPPHRHEREEECSYVLEGSLTVWRAGSITTIGPGGVIQKPRGEWHTFWNAGTKPVRFLEIIAPGAFAGYFRDLRELLSPRLAAGEPPDAVAVNELAHRYGLEFDFKALAQLIAEHGLTLG